MPYICLAQALDDGIVQVTDLLPNSSRQGVYDPPGQTRYLTRAANDIATRTAVGTLQQPTASGVSAYLFDNVEPGGLESAGATLTCTGVLAGDLVTINGQVFTAVNGGAVAANQTFDMSGGDNATATSLAATINDAASIALMDNATGQPAWAIGGYASGVALNNVVTLLALTNPAAAARPGPNGDLPIATSNAVRLLVTGNDAAVITQLSRINGNWNTGIVAASAALIARVDAGQVLTLAGINAVLTTYGAELTNAGGSQSDGSVDDILAIMAGRGYRIRRNHVRTGALLQYYVALYPTRWSGTPLGGFTEPVTVYGTGMPNGSTEIGPVGNGSIGGSIGGMTAFRENAGIRHTYDTGPFRVSVAQGHLATMMAAAGRPPISLYPDSDPVPHFPWTYQGALTFPTQVGVRLVTVYDDDGSLLTP